ncbi:transglutaminase superfamily protein [Chitinophaga dinghuensis]|uniref:Transglutaminase superfamily protein n=1 Tax=Chitinophaga dinghuensis TaxID=1539050 RepID=A0A327VIM2_9BACT|nr:transglutaminase-like domain-containing protein [Chitinophaga dinghuensis]RAJ73714.1 transglutaminase superfamily protein [Chitinophaga dinghuensis]
MHLKPILLFTGLLFSCTLFGQNRIPVIKANSEKVKIKVDGKITNDNWTVEPKAKPDVYKTAGKAVTFLTDIDSITIRVKPGTASDFVILLNGKDSALTRIQYQPSRLEMLKAAKAYDTKDQRVQPAFTYLSSEDPTLKRIRQEMNLDSIAGEGTEVSKMINLLQWVHNEIRHDGGSDNPKLRNALDIIAVCHNEKRGVNCRMMATVLNECYLAMGFKSRFITCMPKEIQFDDCHVINMVYSEDLKKWLWMDPTFGAYVMNEKGELLSVQEVRERLVNNKPLILNPDANWNRKVSQTKENYLEKYMAKNLYRIECLVGSGYDMETRIPGKKLNYIQLVPLDGLNQKGDTSANGGVSFNTNITNNPDVFWAKP